MTRQQLQTHGFSPLRVPAETEFQIDARRIRNQMNEVLADLD